MSVTSVNTGGPTTAARGPALHRTPARPAVATRRTQPRWVARYALAVGATDLLAAVLATVAAHGVNLGEQATNYPGFLLLLAFPACWVLLVHVSGGYETRELGTGAAEFRSVLRAGVVLLAGIAFVSYALALSLSRGLVVVAVPAAVLLTAVFRYVVRRRVHALRAQGRCMRTVVAVGRERAVLDLVLQLRRDHYCGIDVVAACVPDPSRADLLVAAGVPVLGDLETAADVVHATGADAVAVTSASETAATYLRKLSWELEGRGVELLVAPGLMEVAGPRLHMRPFVGLPLLAVEEPNFRGSRRVVKTMLDRVAAAGALLALLPLLLVVAAAVRIDSPGPVLYRQERVGKGGKTFVMYKFRSMVVGADARRAEAGGRNLNEDGLLFKARDDARITGVGRLLRRHSLDELPQLLNVLGGSMSLVGPRPPLPDEVALYDSSVQRRLLVTPGLTGLWQVSGRSDLTWDESVRLDLRYVENWSLSLDLMILWKTIATVVRARGAY